MNKKRYQEIVGPILKAAEHARAIGIVNVLQPGLVKEMIIADLLGHELIHPKRKGDAHALGNPDEPYEYLSCKEDGTGQLGRMFREPPDKRAASLHRITRNSKIYFAVFYNDNQTKCKVIYELKPEAVLTEAKRRLDRSRKSILHVGLSTKWAKRHGKLVYKDRST